jgi:hypothetical protein
VPRLRQGVLVRTFRALARLLTNSPAFQVSITFDPFMYVTTNLPVTKKWTGTIFFVPLDPTKPRYAVRLSFDGFGGEGRC